jgi:hypothetical protein
MNGTIYCEYSGVVREAFRKLGWNMWSCDLLDAEDKSPFHIKEDANAAVVLAGLQDKFAGVHWPCTFFSNSSVRWMYGGKGTTLDPARVRKMRQSAEGLTMLLDVLLTFKIPFYFENPVMHGMASDYIASRLSWFADAPMCTVQPWHFGTWETKRTCLWLHNLPPPRTDVQDGGGMSHLSWLARIRSEQGRRAGEEQAGCQVPQGEPRSQSGTRAKPHTRHAGKRHGGTMGRNIKMSYEIERDVPMPERTYSGNGAKPKFPFASMNVGDSFLDCPGTPGWTADPAKLRLIAKRLGSAAWCWARSRKNDWKFMVRVRHEEGGVRIWRTK